MPRVLIDWLHEETGIKERTLQAMSQRGEIPSAAKLGGQWTYEPDRIRQWIRARETVPCQTISIDGEPPGGDGSSFGDAIYEKAYEQTFGRSPRNA